MISPRPDRKTACHIPAAAERLPHRRPVSAEWVARGPSLPRSCPQQPCEASCRAPACCQAAGTLAATAPSPEARHVGVGRPLHSRSGHGRPSGKGRWRLPQAKLGSRRTGSRSRIAGAPGVGHLTGRGSRLSACKMHCWRLPRPRISLLVNLTLPLRVPGGGTARNRPRGEH